LAGFSEWRRVAEWYIKSKAPAGMPAVRKERWDAFAKQAAPKQHTAAGASTGPSVHRVNKIACAT